MEYEVVARVRYGIWGGHIGTNMTFSRVNSRKYVFYSETLWLVGRALPITFCVLWHWQSRCVFTVYAAKQRLSARPGLGSVFKLLELNYYYDCSSGMQ